MKEKTYKTVSLLFGAATLIIVACCLDNKCRKQKEHITYLESRLSDTSKRLSLYRQATFQTEWINLDAAQVFESTSAFRELVNKMDEETIFVQDTTWEESL